MVFVARCTPERRGVTRWKIPPFSVKTNFQMGNRGKCCQNVHSVSFCGLILLDADTVSWYCKGEGVPPSMTISGDCGYIRRFLRNLWVKPGKIMQNLVYGGVMTTLCRWVHLVTSDAFGWLSRVNFVISGKSLRETGVDTAKFCFTTSLLRRPGGLELRGGALYFFASSCPYSREI